MQRTTAEPAQWKAQLFAAFYAAPSTIRLYCQDVIARQSSGSSSGNALSHPDGEQVAE